MWSKNLVSLRPTHDLVGTVQKAAKLKKSKRNTGHFALEPAGKHVTLNALYLPVTCRPYSAAHTAHSSLICLLSTHRHHATMIRLDKCDLSTRACASRHMYSKLDICSAGPGMQRFDTIVLRQNVTFTFGSGDKSGKIANYKSLGSNAIVDARHATIVTGMQTFPECTGQSGLKLLLRSYTLCSSKSALVCGPVKGSLYYLQLCSAALPCIATAFTYCNARPHHTTLCMCRWRSVTGHCARSKY